VVDHRGVICLPLFGVDREGRVDDGPCIKEPFMYDLFCECSDFRSFVHCDIVRLDSGCMYIYPL
jgi:hypothetical protein